MTSRRLEKTALYAKFARLPISSVNKARRMKSRPIFPTHSTCHTKLGVCRTHAVRCTNIVPLPSNPIADMSCHPWSFLLPPTLLLLPTLSLSPPGPPLGIGPRCSRAGRVAAPGGAGVVTWCRSDDGARMTLAASQGNTEAAGLRGNLRARESDDDIDTTSATAVAHRRPSRGPTTTWQWRSSSSSSGSASSASRSHIVC